MTACLERLTFAAQHAQFQIRRGIRTGGNAHVSFGIINNTAICRCLIDLDSKSSTGYRKSINTDKRETACACLNRSPCPCCISFVRHQGNAKSGFGEVKAKRISAEIAFTVTRTIHSHKCADVIAANRQKINGERGF